MHSPMEQFEIKRLIPIDLGGLDLSFTNSALFMLIAIALITLFLTYAMRTRSWVTVAPATKKKDALTIGIPAAGGAARPRSTASTPASTRPTPRG